MNEEGIHGLCCNCVLGCGAKLDRKYINFTSNIIISSTLALTVKIYIFVRSDKIISLIFFPSYYSLNLCF